MRYIFSIFVFLFAVDAGAQMNLVKNPSFEHYSECPFGEDDIHLAYYWSPSDSTPDTGGHVSWCAPELCAVCDTAGGFGVPYGSDDYYHYAHTGQAFAHVQFFANYSQLDTSLASYQRDYLQGRLYHRLTPGQEYCASFYVVLTHFSAFATDKMGVYFDDGSMDTATWCAWPQTEHVPQVYDTVIVTDTLNWTKIQGTFTATGNETFLTIGNFFDSAHTKTIPENFWWAIGDGNNIYTWYLVDDVCVIPADAVADAGPDRVTSATGDSVWVGDTTADYLPCYWYINGVLADSNISGFKVLPDSTTTYVMALDVCGNITYDTAVVWVYPTAVGSVGALHVLLYPNPASTQLTVEGARGCALTLVDAVGQTVWSLPEAGLKQVVPLAGLTPGIYTLAAVNAVTGERTCRMVEKR